MKKIVSIVLSTFLTMSLFSACSQKPAEPGSQGGDSGKKPSSGVTLEFAHNQSGTLIKDTIDKVCKQFEKETGVKVEPVMPGSKFSDFMKTRMASNDLPDVFTTHGWSVARYGEYLEDLRPLSFSNHIMSSVKPMITDKEGKLYTLPIDMDLTGIIYNEKVLQDAGVKADDIKTWEDFNAACEKIKKAGYTPINIGGKDDWTIGNMLDFVAPTFISNDNKDNQDALLKGTFDWEKWTPVAECIADWKAKGYINVDCITADYNTSIKAFAENKAAFGFMAASGITETYNKNPNAEMGFMPIPANKQGEKQSLMSGEHFAVGAWKNSKKLDTSKKFLEFLAREDICSQLATACGMPAGLDNVKSDTGKLATYYDKYKNNTSILNIPYFDRAYLPSGMWNDLCVTGSILLSDHPNGVKETVKQMETSYKEKMSQK